MTSWWRRISEEIGATGPARSWKQRIARHMGVTEPRRSHLGRISTMMPHHRNAGSWAARLTPTKAPVSVTWSGRIFGSVGNMDENTGGGVKPPPPDGGWGYHPDYGWGYFPGEGEPSPKDRGD